MTSLTLQQQAAISARGNVLVAAGAGTGKTSTVAERCLDLIIGGGCRLDEMLMVTFTEAAAAEMRDRLRKKLRARAASEPAESPLALRLAEEIALLETAPISTLHGFCLELVRRNFHALGLDPQFTVLDEQQTKPLIHAVLDELFERQYATGTPASGPARTEADSESGRAGGRRSGLRELVAQYGNGGDGRIRELVVTIHRHAQALAQPTRWLAEQVAAFNDPSPALWQRRFVEAVVEWAASWRDALRSAAEISANVADSRVALMSLPESGVTLEQVVTVLDQINAADKQREWEYGTKGKIRTPIAPFFEEAAQLAEFAENGGTALAEDWTRARPHMLALLQLAAEFDAAFARAKRELGGIDFPDQEQFALRLLYDESGVLTSVARECRRKYRFVFVDECQDINAAQDAILRAVSREDAEANRFLVGDVKQSIYRFRLADPRIFQQYTREWKSAAPTEKSPPEIRSGNRAGGKRRREESTDQLLLPAFAGLLAPVASPRPVPVVGGRVLPLSENFRSREAVLNFINLLFRVLMRPVVGGLEYDRDAELKFGDPVGRAALATGTAAAEPRVELHIISKAGPDYAEELPESGGRLSELADLRSTEREARLIAQRLRALKESGHQIWNRECGRFVPVEFRDMVVLMRGVAGRAEIFAKAFHQVGVPLHAERAGFLDSLEVTDLLSLLRLLDNPLQDVPLLAVLRSPLVGMSPEELAFMRLAWPRGLLWFALRQAAAGNQPGATKAGLFLDQFGRWRELIRHSSLTHCLECALAETHYEALLQAGERGAARGANVRRFVELARRFDPFQREGLYRFLQFIAEQEEAEVRHQPAGPDAENAVRLMTIHASKGLEFPVVALAGLGTRFNLRELSGDILLNEDLGLCPKIVAPEARTRYPSIAHWLAAQRERRALLGEEMRLLYVALTRACDTIVLTGTATRKDELDRWREQTPVTDYALIRAASQLDWLRLWFAQAVSSSSWSSENEGTNALLRWRFYDAQDAIFALDDRAGTVADPAETSPPTASEMSAIQERLAFRYPHAAATLETAKTSVSALRRRAVELDEEARPMFPATRRLRRMPATTGLSVTLTATDIGNAHHLFMQFVELAHTGSELDLRGEAERLRLAGALAAEEIAALDFAALNSFWQSAIGKGFRALPPTQVHRELPFTARLGVSDLRALQLPLANPDMGDDEFVVIQGVVDLAAITDEEIWLLDFKTDHVQPDEVAAKVSHYGPQVKLYALALTRIYHRPVTKCWLHFFATGTSETVPRA